MTKKERWLALGKEPRCGGSMTKKKHTATVERTFCVTFGQWLGGITAGKHGVGSYEFLDGAGEVTSQMYGVSLENALGVPLGDGATLEVTVRLVRNRPLRVNPWWKRREAEARAYRRKVARQRAAAKAKAGRRRP